LFASFVLAVGWPPPVPFLRVWPWLVFGGPGRSVLYVGLAGCALPASSRFLACFVLPSCPQGGGLAPRPFLCSMWLLRCLLSLRLLTY
jgi:hypothetical protein